jgi:hypothetical protein
MPLRSGIATAHIKKWAWTLIPIACVPVIYKYTVEHPRRQGYVEFIRSVKGKKPELSDDMFNRNYWYRKFLNVAALDQFSQMDEQVQAAFKGEVDIFANEPFDRKNQEDKFKLLTNFNYVLERRLHLLYRNMKARQWNRQFLGVEPTAEDLAQDQADLDLIKSALLVMGKADIAAHTAQNGVPTKEEMIERIKAFGGVEKFEQALKAAIRAQ